VDRWIKEAIHIRTHRQVDEHRQGVIPTLPYLRHPVRPETERRTAIRQTVPTKAPVEAETSTIINKRLFFENFILNNININIRLLAERRLIQLGNTAY